MFVRPSQWIYLPAAECSQQCNQVGDHDKEIRQYDSISNFRYNTNLIFKFLNHWTCLLDIFPKSSSWKTVMDLVVIKKTIHIYIFQNHTWNPTMSEHSLCWGQSSGISCLTNWGYALNSVLLKKNLKHIYLKLPLIYHNTTDYHCINHIPYYFTLYLSFQFLVFNLELFSI